VLIYYKAVSVLLLETFCPFRSLNMKIGIKKEKLYWLEHDVQAAVCFQLIMLWENSRCIITVRHCVHCAKGRKEQRKFTCHLFSWIAGIKPNILLMFFLGLIATLTLILDDCNFWNFTLNNFYWKKVGISVLTCLL